MARIPQPGELFHAVEIQSFAETGRDSHGQRVGTWTTSERVYAKIESLGGMAIEYARQLVQTATHRVTLRYTASLTSASRIKFRNRIFAVGHIEDMDERSAWLVCTCTETDR